jgi:hypothetical protein
MKNSRFQLLAWVRRHEWALVGWLALVALALGMVGLLVEHRDRHSPPEAWSWFDAIYFCLRLFTFDYDISGDSPDPYMIGDRNWPLQVARFLAPATVAIAVVKGVMMAMAGRYNLWRISRWRGHAVVCGAGERGRQLALALRKEGHRVVVIEKNEDCDTLAELRAAGCRVVPGSITDTERQASARLDTAGIVAAVTPCVESNLEVVLAARRRNNGLPLHAVAYAPRSFAAMFEGQPEFRQIDRQRQLGFFDHDAAAARRLVQEYAPGLVARLYEERRPPRILVAGDGGVVPELVGVVVTQCQYAGTGVPAVDLVTVDADQVAREVPLRHPQMPLVADLRVHRLALPEMLRMELHEQFPDSGNRPFDLVFVACREDVDTLSLATNLAQQGDAFAGSLVAGLRPSTQLQRLFSVRQPLSGVLLHDLVALGCSADIVLRARLDEVARSIHESYYRGQLAAGKRYGETPALVPWEELSEGLRQANRSQADHISIKRRTLEISRSRETIEALAEAEHRRWVAEKIVAGWRYAATRDDARRLHPSIRPYAELGPDERQKDRDTVLLAAASITTPP